jgi:hypothetical protein
MKLHRVAAGACFPPQNDVTAGQLRSRLGIRMWSALAPLLALGLLGCADSMTENKVCTPGSQVAVDFTALGTFKTTSLNLDGLTVTGSDSVNVLNFNGLGVVGGLEDNTVDGTESLRFSFNGKVATDISYFVGMAGNSNGNGLVGETTIEAFDSAGTSLGTQVVNDARLMDVSAMFAGQPIRAFVATLDGDFLRINTAGFTLVCQ